MRQTKKTSLDSKIPTKNNKKSDASEVVSLDDVGTFNKIEVAVDGKTLPFKIGDKIEFPAGNHILKTIAAIQINENGIETYLLEWFEDDTFKQYWISMTELKILKDNMKKRNVVSFEQ